MSSGGRGHAVGLGDVIERRAADVLEVRRHLGRLEPLDVAHEVGPGQSGRDGLVALQLRMGQAEPDAESIGAVGKLLEISLEVLDRPGLVVGREAGAAHGVQEAGAEGRALGQLACLVEQGIGGVRGRA